MTFRKLALEQLDRAIEPLRATPRAIPRTGWIRAIRNALGMTTTQLGKRLGLTSQAILDSEKREAAGDVTLTHLRKLGDALNCDVYYALIPRVPLATTVEDRAREIVARDVEELSHSMALEDQQTEATLKEKRIQAGVHRLLQGRWSQLWG